MSGGDLLEPGPRVGPSRAEMLAAVESAGNPYADGFADRVLAGLPRRYSAAELEQALDGLAGPPSEPGGWAR